MQTKNTLSLSERMKSYEKAIDFQLNPCMHYMLRLDGKNFSKMIKKWSLNKPFDKRFNLAMNAAAKSLYDLIPNINLVWHGSDEISAWFIFPDIKSPFFDGRIQKIVSLAASQVSVIFNLKLKELLNYEILPGIFDARLIQFPNECEVFNCFLFRQQDCIRNSISGYAQSYFSAKNLLNKNSNEKIKMLNEQGLDFDKVENWTKFGTFIFKKIYEIKKNIDETFIRTTYDTNSIKINNINDFINIIKNTNTPEKIDINTWYLLKN